MKELYCITCPTGCRLAVSQQDEEYTVEGNGCNRGADFAVAEMRNPMRSLTTTVRTSFPGVPVLPVRTDGEIPKGLISEAMSLLSKVIVRHEVDCGDTVLENIAGSGVRVIATSDILHRVTERATKHKTQRPPSPAQPSPRIIPEESTDEKDNSDEDDKNGDDGDGGGNRGPVVKPSGFGRARIRVPY